QPGVVKLPLTVGDDWGTGAYVLATLRRPLDETAKRMPGRAIGVQWFSVDRQAHTIGVAMDLPALIRPETTLRVPVKLSGLSPNDDARIVVSAVDVDILNLTNYKGPDPDEYYLGQRQLSAEVRDLYGQLIDGMPGTRGQIKTGGGPRRARTRSTAAEPAPSSTAARRRRRRWRCFPALSRSAPDRPRWRSSFRPSPAPSASWR